MDEWQGGTSGTRVEVGDQVMTTDGAAGEVVELVAGDDGTPGAAFLVRRHDGETVEVPTSLVTNRLDGVVYLPLARETLVGEIAATGQDAAGEVGTLVLHEETVDATTVPARRGVVKIVRRVETVPVHEMIDSWHDEVDIERVKIDRQVVEAPLPRVEGDVIVVPVVEEVVVAETKLVLREEIRITRRRVHEPIEVDTTVRRERVDVVNVPDPGQGEFEVHEDR